VTGGQAAESGAAGFAARLDDLAARLEAGSLEPRDVRLARVLAELDGAADLDPEELTAVILAAARCIERKARLLLPPAAVPEDPPDEAGADDPESSPDELAERLAAYRVFQAAAEHLRRFEAERAQRFARPPTGLPRGADDGPGDVDLEALLGALRAVWERARPTPRPVARERVTVAERIGFLRQQLRAAGGPVEFAALFPPEVERIEVVVTFLALLELIRLGEVRAVQERPFAPIFLRWTGEGKAAPPASGAVGEEKGRGSARRVAPEPLPGRPGRSGGAGEPTGSREGGAPS
jgi:segregation and condensation protein A